MIRNISKILLKLGIFLITGLFLLVNCQSVFAQIGILTSNTSAQIYSSKHIGNYSELLQEVIYTFSNTNIKYNILSENELKDISVDEFNIIILPLIADLSQETYVELETYIKNGGKIILVFSDTSTTSSIQKLTELIGVQVDSPQRTVFKTYVNWIDDYQPAENDFPTSTKIATLKPHPTSKAIAIWDQSNDLPAITISPTGAYIGWKWGNDGNLAFNISSIKTTMESLVPGIIKKEQAKLNFREFKDKIAEVNRLREDAQDFLEILSPDDYSSLLADIQEHIYISKVQENSALSYYQNCEYEKAQDEIKKARANAMYAYAKTTPSNVVEGRTLWLDRGTIVTIKNLKEMSDLFDKIQKIGINLVYFETLNAGYTIYPSKITEQNPLTTGWDPLYWAIQEAHKRNIELHAWTWIFAVGNTKHNTIIGKPNEYPGPILSKNPNLILTAKDGSMLPLNQHEYWLDPSNNKSRQIIISILEEIASNYQVDGIQFDYIRYPFQSNNNQMGFNPEGKQKFEIESALKLDNLDNTTVRTWTDWKIKQVSRFVQEASTKLRKIKPDIKISAAVFGTNRGSRLNSIQQDWEAWIEKGWIDILNPMIYASNTTKLAESINYINRAVGTKAFVYPGIAVRQLEVDDLLDQLYVVKNNGLVGNTIFAMAHLGPEKSELLSIGPYRFKEARVPNRNPVDSARLLVEEFLYNVNNIKQDTKPSHAFYKFAGNTVIAEAGKTHAFISDIIDNPSVMDIQKAIIMLKNLENLTQKWLVTENFIKPARVKFLTDYLKRAEILLSYEQHKQTLKHSDPNNNMLTNNILSGNDKN